ncbi:ABC transporter permease [Salinibacterium hongtaonis]|uniref:ABC transporter permease n=1 Tax=Homoserinimonas hongtaonis TaxID=2079791 RepID=A0A2U1SYD1_9MICO|nr:ABC transporter permease [Salinibacterium hongtaonis]AWB89170.1 ABC transporter permease [Salinibacterium hongtaonis]PWB96619.1 ABC transporter permease [Salinibacterium hongtaonis]
MRILLRARESRWLAPAAVLIAVAITLLITAGPIRLAGANPVAAYERYLVTPLSTLNGVTEVLLASTPLIFTGLAVAIAFRVGYYNIGAEGQFLAGAIAATVPGLYLPDLPAALALPLALGAGFIGGAVWAFLPAWLKRHAKIDEVVTTLLLNPVALLLVQGLLNGPWRNSASGFPDSDTYGPGYTLPPVTDGSRVHWGLIIALILVAGTWIVMSFTPLGLRLRAAGQAPAAAQFSGIPVARLQWRCALISGGIAGMGGASQVLGVQHQLTAGISNGYGYTGIVVATLGALTAGGVLLVALLLGTIAVGAQNASISLQLPTQMGAIVSSTLLLAVVSLMALRRYRVVFGRRRPSGGPSLDETVATASEPDAAAKVGVR